MPNPTWPTRADALTGEPPDKADTPATPTGAEPAIAPPPGAEIVDFVFDWDAMREAHPDIATDPAIFLQALCELNPATPRPVCAALGAEMMAAFGCPRPGHEEEFAHGMAWLREQAEGLKITDGTKGREWTKEVKANEWRQ